VGEDIKKLRDLEGQFAESGALVVPEGWKLFS
jgi:hypothetical protein